MKLGVSLGFIHLLARVVASLVEAGTGQNDVRETLERDAGGVVHVLGEGVRGDGTSTEGAVLGRALHGAVVMIHLGGHVAGEGSELHTEGDKPRQCREQCANEDKEVPLLPM